MSVASEVDPMMAVVESWDTYLVSLPQLAVSPKVPAEGETSVDQGTHARTYEVSPFRYHLTDSCPFLCLDVVDNAEEEASLTWVSARATMPVDTASALPSSSLLWLLTLVSRNDELMRAAAHLFLQFNVQFSTLVHSHVEKINALRAHHQHQLASLLEVTESRVGTGMIVDSVVTERVVLRQQQELEAAESRCTVAEQRLEAELQEMFWRFLSTSAPDAVAAANRREQSFGVADSANNAGSVSRSYRAEVDISRFTEVRNASPSMLGHANTAGAALSPARSVPVRTVRLSNEVADASTAMTRSSARSQSKRIRDPMFQPIVLDISPVSGLLRCLESCTGTQPGAVEFSVSSAAEEHLNRLAHTRYSVLLFIGSESAAMDMILRCKSPELLLGPSHSYLDGFQPLAHHPALKILFTTRLWGANVILLWNLMQEGVPAAAAQTVVEDALQLAYAWDADMFSVAVCEGTRMPKYSLTGDASLKPTGSASRPSAVLPSHEISMEVLRQLRNGVTRELIETAGVRRTRRWQDTAAWMQQGIGSGAAASPGTYMCPLAVGTLHASQPDSPEFRHRVLPSHRQQRPQGSHPGSSKHPNTESLTHSEHSTSSINPSSPPLQSQSHLHKSNAACITFNTSLAIRVFLPLAEECFFQARLSSQSKGGRGVSGTAHDLVPQRSSSTAAMEDEDASYSSDVDARFCDPLAEVSRLGIDSAGNKSNAGEPGVRRPQEVPSLESLIRYAFGDFAEIL